MHAFTITDLTVNRALAPLGLTKFTQRLHRLSASQSIHRLITLVSNARFPPLASVLSSTLSLLILKLVT